MCNSSLVVVWESCADLIRPGCDGWYPAATGNGSSIGWVEAKILAEEEGTWYWQKGVCVCVCRGGEMGSSKVPNRLVHAFSVPFNLHVITEAAPRASACVFLRLCDYYTSHTLEDGWRSCSREKGIGREARKTDGEADKRHRKWAGGQRGCVMSSLNRWVASPRVEGNYILCVTPTGAAATATQWLRDRGGVKNWCVLIPAAAQRGMVELRKREHAALFWFVASFRAWASSSKVI